MPCAAISSSSGSSCPLSVYEGQRPWTIRPGVRLPQPRGAGCQPSLPSMARSTARAYCSSDIAPASRRAWSFAISSATDPRGGVGGVGSSEPGAEASAANASLSSASTRCSMRSLVRAPILPTDAPSHLGSPMAGTGVSGSVGSTDVGHIAWRGRRRSAARAMAPASRCRAAPGPRPIASARHRGGRRPRSRSLSQTAAPARRARRPRFATRVRRRARYSPRHRPPVRRCAARAAYGPIRPPATPRARGRAGPRQRPPRRRAREGTSRRMRRPACRSPARYVPRTSRARCADEWQASRRIERRPGA